MDTAGALPRARERERFLELLGLPALGLTFAVTVVSTYVPLRLVHAATPVEIGVVVGGEGFFALFVPSLVGAMTDRTSGRVGSRMHYLGLAAVIMAAALVVVGFVNQVVALGLVIAVFYVGYYGYLAPYWAFYPDLVPSRQSGQAWAAESVWQLLGSALAIIAGGFLLAAWTPLPFLLAAAAVGVVTVALAAGLGARRSRPVHRSDAGLREAFRDQWALARNPGVVALLSANALWNFALAGLRAFVVLFFVVGLGRSTSFVSGVIFPLAALGFVAAPVSGRLADRIGHIRVLTVSCVVYGGGLLVPTFLRQSWVVVLIPIVAAGAATVMTLPYAVLQQLLPDRDGHGALSGLFGLSRGVGSLLGPLVAGAAVELTDGNVFRSTAGYAALWLIIGAAVLASLPFLRRIHLVRPDPPRGRAGGDAAPGTRDGR